LVGFGAGTRAADRRSRDHPARRRRCSAPGGLLFILNPETHFFPTVTPVIGWLLVRGLILAAALTRTSGSVRRWTAISAGMDVLLAVLLIAGL